MPNIDTSDREKLAGAVYFAVGWGTEGGAASYHLAIAGITVGTSEPNWGVVSKVADNSGYTLGAIQVDFGQRGTWAVGDISGRKLLPGEKSYVDAVIEESSAHAKKNGLLYTDDTQQLREDLLSHGNGLKKRSSITFIDEDTRNSINSWASSQDGKQWIHHNIDLPQVRNATNIASDILDAHGKNVADDRKFEAICILAKTANQLPSQLEPLTDALRNGGGYEELLQAAKSRSYLKIA
jgi:ATP-dependent DNA ligase